MSPYYFWGYIFGQMFLNIFILAGMILNHRMHGNLQLWLTRTSENLARQSFRLSMLEQGVSLKKNSVEPMRTL